MTIFGTALVAATTAVALDIINGVVVYLTMSSIMNSHGSNTPTDQQRINNILADLEKKEHRS